MAPTNENAPAVGAARGEGDYQKQSAQFITSDPRQRRVIAALLQGPKFREQLDRIAGAANAPDLVARLRRRGLSIPCEQIRATDRDGRKCWPGVYSLTAEDREKIARWPADER
jgi:hypothetical protein